ncbi:MAG: YraN family protein [Patescibacteria group bacterium]
MNHKQKIGYWGEEQASRFLVRQGFIILERNYHCREGEVDIIAEKDQQLFFIEVKTRLTADFGCPEEAFDQRKKQRLQRAIKHYLDRRRIEADDWQIGLVGISIVDHWEKISFSLTNYDLLV